MFVRDKSLPRLNVTGTVVDLYRSINRARVAPEGAESQPCDVCVISMNAGVGVPSVYVVLFLTENRVRQVYVPEQQPSTMFEYERILQEALDFAESIGFMLDSIAVDDDPLKSAEIVRSIPALHIPGIDPPPGTLLDISSFVAPEKTTPQNSMGMPAGPAAPRGEVSPSAATSRPSDLLARLRSLVQAESASTTVAVEDGFDGMEAAGELILDDISLYDDDNDDLASAMLGGEAPPFPETLSETMPESLDGAALFDDYAPLDLGELSEEMPTKPKQRDADDANSVAADDAGRDDIAPAGDIPAPDKLSSGQDAGSAVSGAAEEDRSGDHDDDVLFADFADFGGETGAEVPTIPPAGDDDASARTESDSIVAEIVDGGRPAIPHTTDLSRLAAGSILEQIGKLLGSL